MHVGPFPARNTPKCVVLFENLAEMLGSIVDCLVEKEHRQWNEQWHPTVGRYCPSVPEVVLGIKEESHVRRCKGGRGSSCRHSR